MKQIVILYIALSMLLTFILWQRNSINNLKHEITLCQLSEKNLKGSIETQNKAIEEMQVKIQETPKRDLSHIIVKDKTCQAELKAYKELFSEFNK